MSRLSAFLLAILATSLVLNKYHKFSDYTLFLNLITHLFKDHGFLNQLHLSTTFARDLFEIEISNDQIEISNKILGFTNQEDITEMDSTEENRAAIGSPSSTASSISLGKSTNTSPIPKRFSLGKGVINPFVDEGIDAKKRACMHRKKRTIICKRKLNH